MLIPRAGITDDYVHTNVVDTLSTDTQCGPGLGYYLDNEDKRTRCVQQKGLATSKTIYNTKTARHTSHGRRLIYILFLRVYPRYVKTAFGSRIIFVLQRIWCTTTLVTGWDPINPMMYTTFYASTLIRGRVICDRDIVSYSIVNTSISHFIANQLTRIRFTYNSNTNKYKVCGKGTTAASLRHSSYTDTSSDDANVFDSSNIRINVFE